MNFDEEPRKTPVRHEIGADLSAVSAGELRQRIALLEEEIARITSEIERKEAGRKAADSLFGPKV